MSNATQFKRLDAAATWREFAKEASDDVERNRCIALAAWNVWDSARLRKQQGVRSVLTAKAMETAQ